MAVEHPGAQDMGHRMTRTWTAIVPLEIAHLGLDGVMHGHSLVLEVSAAEWTCLNAWRARVAADIAHIEGQLELTIGGRTFEDVADAVLAAVPAASRVVVRLPTGGSFLEVVR